MCCILFKIQFAVFFFSEAFFFSFPTILLRSQLNARITLLWFKTSCQNSGIEQWVYFCQVSLLIERIKSVASSCVHDNQYWTECCSYDVLGARHIMISSLCGRCTACTCVQCTSNDWYLCKYGKCETVSTFRSWYRSPSSCTPYPFCNLFINSHFFILKSHQHKDMRFQSWNVEDNFPSKPRYM